MLPFVSLARTILMEITVRNVLMDTGEIRVMVEHVKVNNLSLMLCLLTMIIDCVCVSLSICLLLVYVFLWFNSVLLEMPSAFSSTRH